MTEDSGNLKLLVVYKDGSSCDYHRLITPFADFPKGVDLRFIKYGDTFPEEYFDVDAVIVNRQFGGGITELLRLRSKYGFKIVLDLDDYWRLPYNHYLHTTWKEFRTSESIIEHIQAADIIWVTNYFLYEKVLEVRNDASVHIIRNAINFNIQQFQGKRGFKDITLPVNFCYATGASHKEDLSLIGNLFKRLGDDGKWKREGEFCLGGYENHPIFEEKIKIARFAKNISVTPILPLDEYMKFYEANDVSIAPLVSTEFNKGKSNLKFLEAGAAKMPFICSNVYPYRYDMGMHDKGIKLCDNVNEWYRAFKFFLENKAAIEDYGEANYLEVMEQYNMRDVNIERLQILNTLRKNGN